MAERAGNVPEAASEVIFFGSGNDVTDDADLLYAAAYGAYHLAKERAPHATVIVIGPLAVDDPPPASVLFDRDVLKRAAAAAHAVWVDPIAGRWLQNQKSMIGMDGVHPNDAGQRRLADLIEPTVRAHLPRD